MTTAAQYDASLSYGSTPGLLPLAIDTLPPLLPQAAARYGERTAVIADGRSWSFAELDRIAAKVAHALQRCGIRPGDRVSLWAPNSAAWIACYHGVLRCGAVINPLNVLLTADEVAYALSDSNARALLAGGEKLQTLAARHLLPKELAAVVALDGGGPAGSVAFDAFIEAQPEQFVPVAVEPASLSTICYTSGTTGRPKGAMQSHLSVVFNAAMTAHMHSRVQGDVVLSALPCPHVYGNVVMNSALLNGLTLVLHSRFEEQAVLDSIAKHRVTLFDGVPAMYMALLNHPALARADLGSLRLCAVGGQTMPVAKMQAVTSRFGCPLVELWGMTELSGLGTTFFADRTLRAGSIGVPLPGVEVRIADSNDAARTLPRGEAGELLIRGPIVMLGYFGNEAATRETIEPDGWLHSGDIARMDEDGFVHVVDRKKDMILTAGYNVYPAELERVVAMHPAVAMVAVGAVPDDIKGEVPKAYIVLKREARASAEDIVLHCREHLAAYKIPRQVQFVDDLPKTSTGKLMRRALRTLDAADPHSTGSTLP